MRTEIISLSVAARGDTAYKFPYMYLVFNIIHVIGVLLAIIICFSPCKSLAGTKIHIFTECKKVLGAYCFID